MIPSFGNLLVDEYPLIVLPTLAEIIGLNEAIVLQQIHYWSRINQQKDINFYEGKYWVYNSYEEWCKAFPFWGRSTVIRTIKKLESKNLILSGNFNKYTYDRTKWYTINYNELQNCVTEFYRSNADVD